MGNALVVGVVERIGFVYQKNIKEKFMADKRTGRTQSIKLEGDYFIQSLHKSMFINDKAISLTPSMVKSWAKKFMILIILEINGRSK